jgi:hypothetical protein
MKKIDNRVPVTLWPKTKEFMEAYAKYLGTSTSSVCAHIIQDWYVEQSKDNRGSSPH